MLALLLDRELASKHDVEVLEIAPKACLRPHVVRRGWKYLSSDLSDPAAMLHADLRKMPVESDRFDAIACFHVMEHISDDIPAFREIGRMLKSDGFAVICVPLGGSSTLEGAPKSEWARLYGQYDHVRLYGMDIVERMRSANLAVTTIDSLRYFSPSEIDRRGLRGDDRFLFVVRKQLAA
jgi:SAM-dependent methyltransferase